MIDISCLRQDYNPYKKIYQLAKFKINFARNNPDYFYPDGLTVFVGPQGSGKTLTAVCYTFNLLKRYPKAKLVSNVALKGYKVVEMREFYQTTGLAFKRHLFRKYGKKLEELKPNLIKHKEYLKLENYVNLMLDKFYYRYNKIFPFYNQDDFLKVKNWQYGVIYLVDEIQLYLNSLESKNVNLDVVSQLSQQRKQRKHIVCTSQVFGRMAKPLREQFSCVVDCKKYLGFLQRNDVLDRDSVENSSDDMHLKGNLKKRTWFVHSPEYYERYDTYYIINKNKFVANELKVGDIYDTEYRLQYDNKQ